MLITKKDTLPLSSKLAIPPTSYDFVDSFVGSINDEQDVIGLQEVMTAFYGTKSSWISRMMALRNSLVKPFGLKTGEEDGNKEVLKLVEMKKGHQIGIFKVFDITDNEIILGEDDKHLNFKVSILLEKASDATFQKTLSISTLVKFNNKVGQIYFMVIKPFHKIIVSSMLKKMIGSLNNLA